MGQTWTPINTGLTTLNVLSLALDASNVLYAGTLGSSVFVFEDLPVAIPTLPQWGLILLTLGLMTLATWELTGRRQLIPRVVSQGGGLVLVSPQPLLESLLIGQDAAWASLLVSAVLIAPLVPHDVVGGLMAGLLLGIILNLLAHPRPELRRLPKMISQVAADFWWPARRGGRRRAWLCHWSRNAEGRQKDPRDGDSLCWKSPKSSRAVQ